MPSLARNSSGLAAVASGFRATVVSIATTLGLFLIPGAPALAQINDGLPKEVVGVDVIEHLNEQLPLDGLFRDERNNVVKFGDYFQTGRPVVLVMHYSDCPMLCNQLLTGLVDGLSKVDLTAGTQFDVVAVSIDPKEQPERSLRTKTRYVQQYDRPQSASGWHFLTGGDATIRRLARAVGYQYNYLSDRREYSHAAVVTICTPEGRVSRYLYGVVFDPPTLRLSLLEAADGKFASTLDRFILYCFHYDPARGRYSAQAMRIMQLAGGATVAFLALWLVPLWMRRGRDVLPDAGRLPVEPGEPVEPGDQPAV